MKRVGVLFGGPSVEHEVSIITAMQVIENMDKSRFVPVPIYVTKEGSWTMGEGFDSIDTFREKRNQGEEVFLIPGRGGRLYASRPQKSGLFGSAVDALTEVERIDIFFPALHGTMGEDGAIQGAFEVAGVPYVGCKVTAAASGMDKIAMKGLFQSMGIPVMEGVAIDRLRWTYAKDDVLREVTALGEDLFVKPACLGSSIGIEKVKVGEVSRAIEDAFSYGERVLVERAARSPREINIAIMRTMDGARVSVAEEPLEFEGLLKFEDKYLRGGKGAKGKEASHRKIPAELSEELKASMEELAMKAMQAIHGVGCARIDFLVEDGKPIVNEINTMPGSLAFYLWEAVGLDFPTLLTGLIDDALLRYEEEKKMIKTYDVDLLSRTSYGTKR